MFSIAQLKSQPTLLEMSVSHFKICKKPLNLGVQYFIGFSGIQLCSSVQVGGIIFFYPDLLLPDLAGKTRSIKSRKQKILGLYLNLPLSKFDEFAHTFQTNQLFRGQLIFQNCSWKGKTIKRFELFSNFNSQRTFPKVLETIS